ncbi:MAG: phosphopantetheine-binding protein, partial [Phormidesmis sp.]
VGGAGFGAYAAANAYLDSFATQQNIAENSRWLSLNWDACDLDESTQTNAASELMALAMSKEEVWHTTQRAIAQLKLNPSEFSQLIISPRNLAPRLAAAFTRQKINPDDSPDSLADSPNPLTSTHTRPTLTTAYVAPITSIEKKVANAMGELLGIEAVGMNDNFFELGGHSLLAIQAVTQLRKEFPVELPMRAFLFEAPTAAGIAKIIQEQVDEFEQTANQSTLESLLDQIEEMTPEEVKNEI